MQTDLTRPIGKESFIPLSNLPFSKTHFSDSYYEKVNFFTDSHFKNLILHNALALQSIHEDYMEYSSFILTISYESQLENTVVLFMQSSPAICLISEEKNSLFQKPSYLWSEVQGQIHDDCIIFSNGKVMHHNWILYCYRHRIFHYSILGYNPIGNIWWRT